MVIIIEVVGKEEGCGGERWEKGEGKGVGETGGWIDG